MSVDRRITLQKLEVFHLVVELGSVTKAAERLYVAQPVVTAHLRSLEERLGAELFYREGRALHLTDAGRVVFTWADDVLRRTSEFDRDLTGLLDGTRGSVVLGSSMSIGSYILPGVLSGYRAWHPQVTVRLNIAETDRALVDTDSGDNDFAVVAMTAEPSAPGLVGRCVGHDDFVVVAAPDADVPHAPISRERLGDLGFVEHREGSTRRRFVDSLLTDVGVPERRVTIEMGHPEAMKRAAMAGLGVAMLSRSAVTDEFAAGALREVAVDDVAFRAPIYLVWRKDKSFSSAQQALVAAVEARFGGASGDAAGDLAAGA